MKNILTCIIILTLCGRVWGQYATTSISIPLIKTVVLDADSDIWKPAIKNHCLPKPASGADELEMAMVQQQLMAYRNKAGVGMNKQSSLLPPALMRNFMANAFSGFVPNDNDMAISDSEFVSSVTNVTIWNKNLVTNQITGFGLHPLSISLGLQNEEFDPKLLYDPATDRFIVLFLNGFTDSTSHVVVGFSKTNKPSGAWNFYALPGNPFNNGLWTDFPMMALSDQELFITVNLLYPDSSWQTGFNETIIWQMNKMDGYDGDTLNALVHNNINYNGSKLRNLCPVKGGSGAYGPEMYFMSNRNFAASNDTVFLVKITDTVNAPGATLTVTPLIGTMPYHMPVDAQQPWVDLLATNDARVLGAFMENDQIQFVSNCFDTVTGTDGFYHGMVNSVSTAPTLLSHIYSNALFDYGYPNIAYAGNGPLDNRSIISILYTSPTVNPAFGAILFDGINDFSPVTTIKDGSSYVNMLNGTERWGDYTGCQRRYNQPGLVWISGQYALTNHTTRTWIGEISANTSAGITVNNKQQEEALLFPNPSVDMVTLDFTLMKPNTISIDICDINGKHIVTLFHGATVSGSNAFSFSIASLTTGVYVVQITGSQKEEIATKRIVKK